MSELCEEIHHLMSAGKRFDFSMGYSNIPMNGIYIMFEKGETAHGEDRIVRIGTHTGDNQLRSRIYQHFENKNKNRSIFRKNIGRCFLNKEQSKYLPVWELDTTSRSNKEKFQVLVDRTFEDSIEARISKYIQSNLSFCLLDVPSKEERLHFEARIIGTVSGCDDCSPSPDWLGKFSPIEKIQKSGLWQVMELYTKPINADELARIEKFLVR
ncbi:MAG TPA: hypothetical protein PL044_05005 [Clostridiales bacterium]|jgi:hypothetical protein|nr:MAG: hypothetical protein BWY37_00293 [Firmicutes bacterium ADurb.Bin262]HOU09150.1 hypothetical protein [Clostridiales bacterium]HQK73118.1 hypothetical protein [Clostridiales bacterium]